VAGDTTEAVAMAEFVKAGFPALIPFGENHRYAITAGHWPDSGEVTTPV
jgi:PD-(D/E)XK endonuclease